MPAMKLAAWNEGGELGEFCGFSLLGIFFPKKKQSSDITMNYDELYTITDITDITNILDITYFTVIGILPTIYRNLQ